MAKKKAVTKKVTKKKVTKKKVAAAPAVKKPPTKAQLFTDIAEQTGVSKKDVAAVFDVMMLSIKKNLSPRGAGSFTIPGIAKLTVKKKPATKARKGINPFTGEEVMFKAKPASKTVRLRPMKALKDLV